VKLLYNNHQLEIEAIKKDILVMILKLGAQQETGGVK